MKLPSGVVAVGCAVGGVLAQGPYKWNQNKHARNWLPARETPELGYMQQLGVQPVPTTPPVLDATKLEKRATTDNTCAYVSGDPSRLLPQLRVKGYGLILDRRLVILRRRLCVYIQLGTV